MMTQAAFRDDAHRVRLKSLNSLDLPSKFLCLCLYLIVLYASAEAGPLAACSLIAIGTAYATSVTAQEVSAALKPLLFVFVVALVAQLLYGTYETPLFSLGRFSLYLEPLVNTATMALRLACMMTISIAFMHCTPFADLVRALSSALRPLRKLGVKSDAFMIAFQIALTTFPLLIDEFGDLLRNEGATSLKRKRGGFAKSIRVWEELLESLIRRSLRRVDEIVDEMQAAEALPPKEDPQEGVASRGQYFTRAVALSLIAALAAFSLLS